MREGTVLRFASQVLLGMADVSVSDWRAKMCGVCTGVCVCSDVSQNRCCRHKWVLVQVEWAMGVNRHGRVWV